MTRAKKLRIAGWIMSGVLAALLIGPSASGKFTEWDGKAEMFEHIGYSGELIKKIGMLEIIVTILFIIPRTGFLGAILLTGYLGGAVATHVRVGDPFFMPVIIGLLVWVSLGFRQPAVFSLAAGATSAAPETPKN